MKWLTFGGIKEEIKKIRWPKKDDMFRDTQTVLIFIFGFGLYFVFCELFVAQFLRLLGIGA
ncbi:MAG: preprotein translocase subunit SecE [Erysipelotrichaceae bacterium]|nr:preprotein translocase subunit SecE [Erysipelotrichaceae bacterium]MDD3924656.1 preprotein translocase subunit SecE [Erysipelotrichaceae bacterium]